MDNPNDVAIWRRAHARVGFKRHLIIYLLVNGILWFMSPKGSIFEFEDSNWAYWPALFWGIALAIHYVNAYQVFGGSFLSVEEEYKKLKETESESSDK